MPVTMRAFLVLTAIATASAVTCNIAKKSDVTVGSCGTRTVQYGSCTSQSEADAGLALSLVGAAVIPSTDAACAILISGICAGYGVPAKATKCSDLCSAYSSITTGCTSDSQCATTTTTVVECCSATRSYVSNLCTADSAKLDSIIASEKSKAACSDTNCNSAAPRTLSSLYMPLLLSLLGYAMTSRL
ncbi:hypothetical protein GUITHDRAFT_152285 [Guillardia theta CCMP2712]|uniref:Uncharacterized protein n=1 Tax=Guillardia theta (strain CCMP2712) TaxID=905079 RepID=L1JED1_GUITC|nr:hypothetical protein GUITHDRAFT_152285 [Guillardia theta CCMP2712]EKX46672.1 hypothetical protein GUITHDRAFT_152285 [Guillardia theta CCMP2712]|eukprot:XP_005833652.1 hypothetical protein GUITHDRAFT_152285 [Guillardia theta CCMP2712]